MFRLGNDLLGNFLSAVDKLPQEKQVKVETGHYGLPTYQNKSGEEREKVKTQGTKKPVKTGPSPMELRDQKLKAFVAKYKEPDVRYMYFRSTDCLSIIITAVSILNRETDELKVAFSFCSPKDSFSKAEGKIKCFERLEMESHPCKTVVPWLGDGLLSISLAYNKIEKTEKLRNSKYNSLVSKDPSYHVVPVWS